MAPGKKGAAARQAKGAKKGSIVKKLQAETKAAVKQRNRDWQIMVSKSSRFSHLRTALNDGLQLDDDAPVRLCTNTEHSNRIMSALGVTRAADKLIPKRQHPRGPDGKILPLDKWSDILLEKMVELAQKIGKGKNTNTQQHKFYRRILDVTCARQEAGGLKNAQEDGIILDDVVKAVEKMEEEESKKV